mgnify:CR=1 FL=1
MGHFLLKDAIFQKTTDKGINIQQSHVILDEKVKCESLYKEWNTLVFRQTGVLKYTRVQRRSSNV